MIIVTGGAGFIGSNIVYALNLRERKDILVVDNLTDGIKFNNLVDCDILDFVDKTDFQDLVLDDYQFPEPIEAIFHQGACTNTTEWNGQYLLHNNYEYSKILLRYCQRHKIPFIYASSAAVYGSSEVFKEERTHERPLNVYGYSKYLFDQNVRLSLPQATSQIVGLRYFNVYGPREAHKGNMASEAYHFHKQILKEGVVKLFESDGDAYGNGEQRRDFVFVSDVVAVNLWFLDNPDKSGIFNVGTGTSETYNTLAKEVIHWHKMGQIEYIPFPENLRGHYQNFTQADITELCAAGYPFPFKTVAEGVKEYLDWLYTTQEVHITL